MTEFEFIRPDELAKKAGWSARRVRQLAREIGACRIVGNRMVLTPEDVQAILEASRPKPRRMPDPPSLGGYAALVKLRERNR